MENINREERRVALPKYRKEELEYLHLAYIHGRQLADAGSHEDAIGFLDKVLIYLPRRRRDRTYRIESTIRQQERGVSLLPMIFREALMTKAYCLNELGRYDDAYHLLQRAVELDPENPHLYAELGFVHGAQDNLELARSAYLVAAELEPNNADHLRALAHLALLADDFEDARTKAQQALVIDPTAVHSLHQLAFAEYRLGNLETAISHLRRAFELEPDDLESMMRLAGTLREADKTREAIRCIAAYLQRHPRDPEALGLMTDFLQHDGRAPELVPHAHLLLERNPRDPVAYDLLAWGYYQQGQMDKALEAMRCLVQNEPMQPFHHFKLGMLYQTLGNLPLAMASLQRAAALDNGGDIARMATESISNLDQVQIEQLLARADEDPQFRYHLQCDLELTLHQAGYLLSPVGVQMLRAFNIGEETGFIPPPHARTIN